MGRSKRLPIQEPYRTSEVHVDRIRLSILDNLWLGIDLPCGLDIDLVHQPRDQHPNVVGSLPVLIAAAERWFDKV